MFFLRRTRPLELTAGRLRSLRVSLNTPVVATQDLPIGPARAAIAIHAEPRGGLTLTVGVRSLGAGSVVLYGFEGSLTPALLQEGMDAALAFAEGMGFLFDDELLGADTAAQEKALVRWHEAIGVVENAAAPAAAEASPRGAAAHEADDGLEVESPFDLFDLDGGELTDPPVMPAPAPAAAPRRGAAPPALEPPESPEGIEPGDPPLAFEPVREASPPLPLTKFRLRADTPGAPKASDAAEAPRKRPLGRVQLTKRRSNTPAQEARRSWLLRLLTAF